MSVDEWSDRELIDEILDAEKGLSPWEINFAESCDRFLEADGVISENQRAKARSIVKSIQEAAS